MMKNKRENLSPDLQKTLIEKQEKMRPGVLDLEPYLVIVSGQEQGKQFKLQPGKNIIGRISDVDIQILDAKMSRKHGALIISDDSIYIEDYQSTNGCFVNEIRIKRQQLETTARIRIGNTVMKVEYKKSTEVESEMAVYTAANTDGLTGLSNRHAFKKQGNETLKFCQQQQETIALLIADIDFFKRINDQFGHLAGDEVLIKVADILQSEMRKGDLLARYGGEEFIVLLHGKSAESAYDLAERIRKKVEKHQVSYEDSTISVTISLGVSAMNASKVKNLEALTKHADHALYRAKNNGRNRVESAEN